jgi:rhodanese-related sulfurtransferase
MRNISKLSLFLVTLLALSVWGCSEKSTDATPEPVNEAQVLLSHLEANGDYINTSAPSVIAASDVRTMMLSNPTKQYIIDVRAAADFTAGRIEGAKNVTIANLLSHMKTITPSNYDRIVIVCYSGQSAAFGASLLRLMGYNNVFSMKFGMASWATQFATSTWKANVGNSRANDFVSTSAAKNTAGSLPTISTGKTSGTEILEARVNTLLTEGFSAASITNATLYTALSNYYIINYWSAAEYADPGHISGAVNYIPKSELKSTVALKTLPTNKTVVVYCYTGQTSAYIAAYLKLLGYDAKSLNYGGNGMIYDKMLAKNMTTFKDADIMNYPVITGQ